MQDDAEPFEPTDTDRLRLRCVGLQDAQGLSDLMTSAVSAWVAAWPVPFTPAMAVERILTARAAAFARTALPCSIERRADGALLGWISVRRDGDRGVLGYWLGEAHQGRGIMREAVPALIRAAFRLLEVEVLEAAAQLGNAASFAVLRACRMAPAGERMIFAPSRGRDELCLVHEVSRAEYECPRAG